MDLLWNIACPTFFVYGDRDVVMPPERMAELCRRLEQWEIEHVVRVLPGAAHSFGAPVSGSYDAAAYELAWQGGGRVPVPRLIVVDRLLPEQYVTDRSVGW